MNFNDIRAGVVGIGFIGVAHVEALRRLGVHVAGVVGSTPERARAKADATGLGRVYDSVEAMAADDSIDVVHIARPNYAHADQVRICQRVILGGYLRCRRYPVLGAIRSEPRPRDVRCSVIQLGPPSGTRALSDVPGFVPKTTYGSGCHAEENV